MHISYYVTLSTLKLASSSLSFLLMSVSKSGKVVIFCIITEVTVCHCYISYTSFIVMVIKNSHSYIKSLKSVVTCEISGFHCIVVEIFPLVQCCTA